ncbi:hypothetical protein D1872_297660 [compost metagenome]
MAYRQHVMPSQPVSVASAFYRANGQPLDKVTLNERVQQQNGSSNHDRHCHFRRFCRHITGKGYASTCTHLSDKLHGVNYIIQIILQLVFMRIVNKE